MKVCSKCGEEKAKSEFYKDKSTKDRLTGACKPCRNGNYYKWAAKNRDKVNKAERKRLQENPDQAKRKAETNKRWQDGNREHYRQLQREWRERTGYNEKRRLSGVDRAYVNRSRCSHVTPPWADHDRINEMYRRAAELTETTGERYEVDHIIPINHDLVSGLHVHNNLRVIPMGVNRSKHSKFAVK